MSELEPDNLVTAQRPDPTQPPDGISVREVEGSNGRLVDVWNPAEHTYERCTRGLPPPHSPANPMITDDDTVRDGSVRAKPVSQMSHQELMDLAEREGIVFAPDMTVPMMQAFVREVRAAKAGAS